MAIHPQRALNERFGLLPPVQICRDSQTHAAHWASRFRINKGHTPPCLGNLGVGCRL
jgi:hypothetical protein